MPARVSLTPQRANRLQKTSSALQIVFSYTRPRLTIPFQLRARFQLFSRHESHSSGLLRNPQVYRHHRKSFALPLQPSHISANCLCVSGVSQQAPLHHIRRRLVDVLSQHDTQQPQGDFIETRRIYSLYLSSNQIKCLEAEPNRIKICHPE